MEVVRSDDLAIVVPEEDQGEEIIESHVSAADLQRAHTRVATQLGDVVCEDRDTVSVTLESDD